MRQLVVAITLMGAVGGAACTSECGPAADCAVNNPPVADGGSPVLPDAGTPVAQDGGSFVPDAGSNAFMPGLQYNGSIAFERTSP